MNAEGSTTWTRISAAAGPRRAGGPPAARSGARSRASLSRRARAPGRAGRARSRRTAGASAASAGSPAPAARARRRRSAADGATSSATSASRPRRDAVVLAVVDLERAGELEVEPTPGGRRPRPARRRASARTRPADRRGPGSDRRPAPRRPTVRGRPAGRFDSARPASSSADSTRRARGSAPRSSGRPDRRRAARRPSPARRRAGRTRRAARGRAPAPPPARARTRVAAREPRPAGRVPAPLAAELADGRAVAVLDARAAAQLEPPARLLQPPAEVGVLGGADALVEAAELLERGAADEQVGGDGARQVRVAQMRLLARGSCARRRSARRACRPRAAGTTSPASAPTSSATGAAKYASSSPGGARQSASRNRIHSPCARAAPTLRACAGERSPAAATTATPPRADRDARVVGEDQLVAGARSSASSASTAARAAAASPANGITTLTAGRLTARSLACAASEQHAAPASSSCGCAKPVAQQHQRDRQPAPRRG